jgi:hypothetical protein
MMRTSAAALLSVLVALSAPAFATDYRGKPCKNCVKPRPHYDSQEVVRTTKDVDHSRVINTQSVVYVKGPKPVRTHNHLLIRKNTIRHVGVVRHNHLIIEKEIRYRRPRVHAPPVTVNFVTQKYHTVHRPALVEAPVIYPRKKHRVLHVRG